MGIGYCWFVLHRLRFLVSCQHSFCILHLPLYVTVDEIDCVSRFLRRKRESSHNSPVAHRPSATLPADPCTASDDQEPSARVKSVPTCVHTALNYRSRFTTSLAKGYGVDGQTGLLPANTPRHLLHDFQLAFLPAPLQQQQKQTKRKCQPPPPPPPPKRRLPRFPLDDSHESTG